MQSNHTKSEAKKRVKTLQGAIKKGIMNKKISTYFFSHFQ